MSRAGQRLTRISRQVLVLGGLWGLLLTLGCGSGDDESPRTAAPPEPAPPSAPAPPTPAPVALEPGDAAAGAESYASYCASCHGDGGCGDGPLASTLDPRPAAHCDGNVMNGLEDAYLLQVITDGGPAVGKSSMMAPWGGSLGEQQILDLVAFIRSLADPPYQP